MVRVKGCFSVFLSSIIILTICAVALAGGQAPLKMSLNDCLLAITDDHPQIKLAKYKVQEAQMELQKLKLEDPATISGQELAQAEALVANAEKAMIDAKYSLYRQVEEKYYGLLRALQTVKSQQESLQWMEKQMQITKIKYDSGMVPQKDMQTMDEQLNKAKRNLEDTNFNLQTFYMEFDLLLGWPLDRVIEPLDREFPFEPLQVTLDEITTYSLEHSSKVVQAREAVKEAEANLRFKKLSEESQAEITRAENALSMAQIELEQAIKEQLIAVRGTYKNIISGTEHVQEAKIAFEQAKKEQDILKVKYDAGMIPLLELVKGRTSLAEKEIGWIQAIYDYNLLKVTFNQAIGKEYSPRR